MRKERPVILIGVAANGLRGRLREIFAATPYELTEIAGAAFAASAIQSHVRPDLVVLEASVMAPFEAITAATQIRQFDPHVPMIMMATRSSEELAIAALRAGFCDYFPATFSEAALLTTVQRLLSDCRHRPAPLRHAPELVGGDRMVGESNVIHDVKNWIGRVATSNSNVLITGETGTGKELTAQLIHENSERRSRPLVCINCAAIPDGLLESELFGYERGAFTGAHTSNEGKLASANGGTVFLDEIGDLSPYAQAKVLRAIETKQVHRLGGRRSLQLDIRVIAGTNQNLDALVGENKFRQDLYFRLNVVRIHLPPLRQRKNDLRLLFDHCIAELNGRFGRNVRGLTQGAVDQMLDYDWPGNVRELRNLMEALFVAVPAENGQVIDIPETFRARLGNGNGAKRVERERLLETLLATNWNKSKAAQQLRWSRMTLYRKMSKYNLESQ